MKKALRYSILGLIICVAAFKILQATRVLNDLTVECEAPLKSTKVDVKYGVTSFSEKSEKVPHNFQIEREVYNGWFSSWIPFKYGETDFLVVYDDKYYGTFRYFNKNTWDTHSYALTLRLKNDTIKCAVSVDGRSDLHREFELKEK